MSFKQKYTLYFILFFLIFYLEGTPPIGGLSFAQLWKLPILFMLIIFNIKQLRPKKLFENSGYLLSIQNVFSPEISISPLSTIVDATKQLPFILFFGYWVGKFRRKYKTLETILYSFAQYIILSTIPIHLGIITPLKSAVSADKFGVEGVEYFMGLFGSFHSASSYFSASLLVIFNGFLTNRFKTRISKMYNVFLFIVGLYSIFKSYTRTGWLMLIVGLLSFINFSKITTKQLSTYIFCTLIAFIGLFYFYSTNEAFYARMTGVNIHTGEGDGTIELSGSGRTSFWMNGITCWLDSENTYELLFGRGRTTVLDYNERYYGLRLISHSQFIDMLAQHGLIALILLFIFYFSLWRYIESKNKSKYYLLNRALLLGSLIFAILQSEMYFNYAIIFSITLSLTYIEYYNTNNHDTNKRRPKILSR